MILILSKVVICLLISGQAVAFDPFEGTPPLMQCLKGRKIIGGCNETLLQAYKRTEASNTDQNINEANTSVYLYTIDNPENPEFLHECGGRLPNNTLYKAERKTVVIVGGHLSSVCGFSYFRDMKTQLLIRGCYNVILIDWPWGNGADIYQSMYNTEVVGKQMAFFIEKIMAQTGATCEDFHLIGHAYGAHACGIAGHLLSCQLRRITGLSPFGGIFINTTDDKRLDPSDAKLVDVINTGAGKCFPFELATTVKSGHADFYPNGGFCQPGCTLAVVESYLKGDFFVGTLSLYPPACYLFQSVRYFLASINACPCLFVGVRCDSFEEFASGTCRSCGEDGSNCAVMGMDFENYPHATGIFSYYLKTDRKCPYCDNSGIHLHGYPKNQTGGGECKFHCPTPN